MPQANIWQRCACPGENLHPRGACPQIAGFERQIQWLCLPCVTGCSLVIIPSYQIPWTDWNGKGHMRLEPGVITSDAGRASDSDRDQGFTKLEDAFVVGKIDQEEYERRLDLIGDAIWRSDIRAALADLV